MKRTTLFLFLMTWVFGNPVFGTGEAGTYFNVFIPPSNVSEGKDISVIVTALYDSTFFRIKDTGEDGDNDDDTSGMLMSGQSYVLYIRDNDVNDDANHVGDTTAEQDGDHFLVAANKLILVSQAAKSDWEHDWLPATNKSSKGSKFFVYGNEVTTSPNDLNVMAYEDSTYISIWKISKSATSGTGYTNVSLINDTLVSQFMLSPGQDIIYQYHYGRDVLKPGETYLVQSNKDVTVQYGALYTDESDGGGFVPSSNGTGAGDLFYFAVPFEDSTQQEIRIVSWSDNNNVLLERYNNGQWITVNQFNSLPQYKAVEWVGATLHQTYATVFRVTCSPGKKVTVFEANWIETGSTVTSDISSMAPSANGMTAGKNFALYMPVPTEEGNVTDALTGNKLPLKGTHAYIFGNRDTASIVTVKDAGTNGTIINRTYSVPAGFYADCVLDSAQWVSIYNGTGTLTGGPNRPYLLVSSDNPVSVDVTNFNDNWMMYFGSAIPHGFDLSTSSNKPQINPGDTVQFTTFLNLNDNIVRNGIFKQTIDNGFKVISSFLIDSTTHTKTQGRLSIDTATGRTYVTYPQITQFDTTHLYRVLNQVLSPCTISHQTIIQQHTILSIETTLTGNVHDSSEMAAATAGVARDTANVLASPEFSLSSTSLTEGEEEICTAVSGETSYSWNFGDGHNCTGRVANQEYQSSGEFNITLTVTNSAGCAASASEKVSVAVKRGCENTVKRICAPETRDTSTTDNYEPTGSAEVSATQSPVIWSAVNKVYIDFTGVADVNADINVYNLLGQQLVKDKYTNNLLYTHEIDNVSTSYLIVAVKNNGRIYTRKVFIGGGPVKGQ